MSNIIPPLISNSPPPLDLAIDSEEEDEFQPPTLNYLYSCDDFELPNDLPDMDIPEIDINRNNRKEDKDFHDKRKSNASDEFINSDVILPNIEEIVPNTNDLKNVDTFDAEDIEITSIANKEEILKTLSGLIPKIADPIIDGAVNYVQNHVELELSNYKTDCDTNTLVETVLNANLNDKTISDKELSSSEPIFESCSDNSQKDNETDDAGVINKMRDKSICDVDEIDDDFGDFADFNNANAVNFAQNSNDGSIVLLIEEQIDDKLRSDFNHLLNAKLEANLNISAENIAINLAELNKHQSLNYKVASEENKSTTVNLHEHQQHIIDFTRRDSSIRILNKHPDMSFTLEHSTTNNFELTDVNSTKLPTSLVDAKIEPSYSTNTQNTPSVKFGTVEDSDDEFGEFDSCTAIAELQVDKNDEASMPDLHIDRCDVSERSAKILEMMFPVEEQRVIDFTQDERDGDDTVFSKIRNLTETNALTYQWNKSDTQQSLLKVLNVDVRNILYGPCWNPSMPIFAANLTSAPLEPQKTNVSPTISSASNAECIGVVSDAQFDWANSGLTNPLDVVNQKDASLKECTLTLPEPPKSFDSESVNSLQFTEAIIENIDDTSTDLPEFDSFTDFQAVKAADVQNLPSITNAMFPLRESYINSNDETAQSNGKNTTDDDFTEFQASLPEIMLLESKQSTNRSIEYKLAIENPIEPELIEANSSKIIPSAWQQILQPLKVANVNSTVSIAWPEPGITDDEIRKFEEYSYKKNEHMMVTKNEIVLKINDPKQIIDDEWSDFQDAAKELPLSIASLGKIAQIQSLASVQSASTKQHTYTAQTDFFSPSGAPLQMHNDDEWSEFVSHQPSPFRPVSNVNPRQEDWTIGGPQFNSWSTTTSSNSHAHFNGFNSFGRGVLANAKTAVTVPGKSRGIVPILGGQKRESVPSISALPDLDFAISASRFSSGRPSQHQKK